MNKVRYLLQSMNVLNFLLMLTVIAAAYYSLIPFADLGIRTPLPAVRTTETEKMEVPAPLPSSSLGDYIMVSEQNLFHSERRVPLEQKDDVSMMPKPDLILFGTLITPDLSIAFVEDKKTPYSTPGRGKRQTQLKKGEMVGGYVVQDIEPDRIVLAKGEEKIVVMLNTADKRKGGETPAPAPGRPQPGVLLNPAGMPPAPRAATPAAASSTSPATNPAATPAAATVTPSSTPDAGRNAPLPSRMLRRGR